MDATRLIGDGEAAYQAGNLETALAAFREAARIGTDAAVRREARNDAAVALCDLGRAAEAELMLREALSRDGADAGTLENLGHCLNLLGKSDEAVEYLGRAVELAPLDGATRLSYASALLDAREPIRAHDATVAARSCNADPGECGRLITRCNGVIDEYHLDVESRDGRAPRALLGVEYFYPSVGGSERVVEDLGTSLIDAGWDVHIVTRRLDGRRALRYRGMSIHETDEDAAAVHRLCERIAFDAVVPLAFPHTWPLLGMLTLPAPRPRVLMVPCVNEHAYARARSTPGFLAWYADALRQCDGVGYVSQSGWDRRMLDDVGVDGMYMPNAVHRWDPAPGGFRERYGIPRHQPLLLVVATLWGEKNHAGLLEVLRDRPGDWRLVVIGGPPSEPFANAALPALHAMAREPRVLHVPHADRHLVAAALSEATLLVHPSLADSGPLVILEAMSHRLPWLATPTCGAAREAAGGIVAPVAAFGALIDRLLANAEARAALGAAGEQHWRAAYSWQVMGPRYSAFLHGDRVATLDVPIGPRTTTDTVRRELGIADQRSAA
jgi:glycosyltransferase involved in cell wall biosynthesis